jgi:geranylgeranyl transferase type-2 subunit alpha
MHNVRRLSADKRASRRKENEERAAAYRSRSKLCFDLREAKQHDQATLDAISKVVCENTDIATLWNFRRQVLESMYPAPEPAASDVAAISALRKAACEAEFALTQECLGLNPKSYPVWHHRQWVLEWGRCSWQWPVELKLTMKLLALDDRNFHCWTYRRFVVKTAGVTAEAELGFTTSKIEANFSNYSAWHYRSKLLPEIHRASSPAAAAPAASAGDASASLGAVLRSELQLVRNAFFTAPEDSSAWFYHRWLLAQLKPGGAAAVAAPSEYAALLRDELAMVDELLELEPDCKWVLAASAFLSEQLAGCAKGDGGGGGAEAAAEAAAHAQKLRELGRVDPLRGRYYADRAAAVAVE